LSEIIGCSSDKRASIVTSLPWPGANFLNGAATEIFDSRRRGQEKTLYPILYTILLLLLLQNFKEEEKEE
jgi:hypothetical protein